MENPEEEIRRVVKLLTSSDSPDIQQGAVRKCVLCGASYTARAP